MTTSACEDEEEGSPNESIRARAQALLHRVSLHMRVQDGGEPTVLAAPVPPPSPRDAGQNAAPAPVAAHDDHPHRSDDAGEKPAAVEEDEEDPGDEIPRDSFSIFYVAESWREHVLPIFVFLSQMGILGLMFFNLLHLEVGPIDLPFNIAVNVDVEVTIAQYVACLVSVYTAKDFACGIYFAPKRIMRGGECLPLVGESQRPPFSAKWVVSNVFRMAEGMGTILVSFLFIVQSTTVIDLFLNFAGVAFVSTLDDVSFQLADQGFLGIDASRLADEVAACKVHSKRKGENGRTRKTIRILIFAAVLIGMWSGLSGFFSGQHTLRYACKSVQITIGADGFQEFSGTYILHETTRNRRAVYVQEQGRGSAFLGYCRGAKRWSVSETNQLNPVDLDPCKDYLLHSERITTYDITEVSELRLKSGEDVNGNLKCSDCSMKQDNDSCGWKGTCTEDTVHVGKREYLKNACVCGDNRFGDSCQFIGPCTELRFQEFPGYHKSFNLLVYKNRSIFVHDRPTYIQGDTDDESAVLLYNGGRWLVILSTTFEKWEPAEKTLGEYLEQEFNSRNHGYAIEFISESTRKGMPGNVPFRAKFSDGEELNAVGKLGDEEFTLLCADCDESDDQSYCMNTEGDRDSSLCQEKNSTFHNIPVLRCQCEAGFIGPLCQTRPVEGKLLLHLEHGGANMCSVCGEHNEFTVWHLIGFNNATCLPFPREPLQFEGANGTVVSRQLGLNLNKTHYSVFIASSQTFFPPYRNDGASELICTVQEGSKEIYSISRDEAPREQIHLDFAVLLDADNNFFGQVIGSDGIDCFTTSSVSENECVSFHGEGALSQVYGYDPLLQKSNLVRAWIQFDLKVTK